jgi:mannose-6-phosphate isomerase-like protein (cupin superfamily)
MATGNDPSQTDPPPQVPQARVGELLENPVTGERGIVRVPPGPANGDLLVADIYLRPGARVSGEHVHPAFTEAFTVVRGRLGIRHGDRPLQAGRGTRVQVPPGVVHDFWNAGPQEAHVILEVQPAQRFMLAIRQLFLLAQDGRTDAKGRPRPLQAAVIAREFADTFRFTSPPQPVQRLLFGLLAPIARATGHRGINPEYLRRELPTVALEPLPAEIVARVPGLAAPPTGTSP